MRYVLLNEAGRPLMVVKAPSEAEAACHGLYRRLPGYHGRAVSEAEFAAPHRRLEESARKRYLAEGRTPEEADRMAALFARGRGSEYDTSRLPFAEVTGAAAPASADREVRESPAAGGQAKTMEIREPYRKGRSA